MSDEQERWVAETIAEVEAKISSFTKDEQANMGLTYFKRVLERIPQRVQNEQDFSDLKGFVEKGVALIPQSAGRKDPNYPAYRQQANDTAKYLSTKYQVVRKGYYVSIWMGLGVALGLVWGLLLYKNNIGIGMCLGIAIGLTVGAARDRQADKDGRVI